MNSPVRMRVRSLLLPAAQLLNSIPNDRNRRFTDDERKLMVMSVLNELTTTEYNTFPHDASRVRAPYQGYAFVIIKGITNTTVSDRELVVLVNQIKNNVRALLRHYSVDNPLGHPPLTETDWPVPLLFDHGVKYAWVGKTLQATWLRPTVDYKEMSVNSYLVWLSKYLSTRKHKPAEAMKSFDILNMGTLLSTVNLIGKE